jgi:radical SAM protein with 4Fe4S-binding SPASM domain
MDFPLFIQLYPTLRCNQKCVFCFNNNIPGSALCRDMSEHEAFCLVDTAAKHGVREIDILGGEPLLISWMKNLVTHASDSGLAVNLSTNGSLPDRIMDLAETSPVPVNIGVSVLGLSETHNKMTASENFSKAIKGIERLVSCGRNPIVKSVLMRENRKEIFRLAGYLANLGVRRYFLLHEDVIGRSSSQAFSFPEYYAFYEALKKELGNKLETGFVAASGFYKYAGQGAGRCDAGITKIAVMPDGSAFPCNLLAGSRDFFLGDIFRDGIEKIRHSPVLGYFRDRRTENPCERKECPHFETCGGGCPAHRYFFFGSMEGVDPRCRFSDLSLTCQQPGFFS